MNTDRLYIASLRMIVNQTAFQVTHKHVKYVLVKSLGIDFYAFKDLSTNDRYNYLFYNGNNGVDLETIQTFSEATGYTKRHITKRKALTLFNQKVEEWRSK